VANFALGKREERKRERESEKERDIERKRCYFCGG
jgi:hypothetical protein